MNKIFRYLGISALAIVVLHSTSCKEKDASDEFANEKGHYFSMNEYMLDAWNTYIGAPFLIMKTTRVDKGRVDSSLTNSDTINWAPIFQAFAATDISDHKYLGQYNFNQFDDPKDETHNFFYMAKDPEMYTQKLLITLDQNTMKVKGIYIETFHKTTLNEITQKLYYNPMKTIQIQTTEHPTFGKDKYWLQQWDFLRQLGD